MADLIHIILDGEITSVDVADITMVPGYGVYVNQGGKSHFGDTLALPLPAPSQPASRYRDIVGKLIVGGPFDGAWIQSYSVSENSARVRLLPLEPATYRFCDHDGKSAGDWHTSEIYESVEWDEFLAVVDG